jgi:four helix bundle protein
MKSISLIIDDSPLNFLFMKEVIKKRTRKFAAAVWRFCQELPNSREYNAYVRQLIRSSSSVGANYRAAQRSKSTADFIYKLKIVEEEADETLYFLELLIDINSTLTQRVMPLHKEGNEILSIIVASIKTARKRSAV